MSLRIYNSYLKRRPEALSCINCSEKLNPSDIVIANHARTSGYGSIKLRCVSCAVRYGIISKSELEQFLNGKEE